MGELDDALASHREVQLRAAEWQERLDRYKVRDPKDLIDTPEDCVGILEEFFQRFRIRQPQDPAWLIHGPNGPVVVGLIWGRTTDKRRELRRADQALDADGERIQYVVLQTDHYSRSRQWGYFFPRDPRHFVSRDSYTGVIDKKYLIESMVQALNANH